MIPEYQLFIILIMILIIIWRLLLVLFKPAFKISGVTKDTAGTPIPGAELTLTNQDTGEAFSGTSGGDGVFSFPNMKAGSYDLEGQKDNGDGSHYAGGFGFSITGDFVTDLTLEKAIAKR